MGWAKRSVPTMIHDRGSKDGTAPTRLCPLSGIAPYRVGTGLAPR
jgi:hypothetical protein